MLRPSTRICRLPACVVDKLPEGIFHQAREHLTRAVMLQGSLKRNSYFFLLCLLTCYVIKCYFIVTEKGGELSMPAAVKIKSFKINRRNERQLQITVPREWMEEHGLREGDSVDLMKDTDNRLIIVPGAK